MTENQRNYLADLAGQKGTRLFDTDNWSVAHASEEIDRLKAMPDATFDELTDDEASTIDKRTDKVLAEMKKWTFQR